MLVQNKVPKQKEPPHHGLRLPCASRQSGRLRNSLRSNSPRRKLSLCLRCSAWQQGIFSQNHANARAVGVQLIARKKLRDLKIAPTKSKALKFRHSERSEESRSSVGAKSWILRCAQNDGKHTCPAAQYPCGCAIKAFLTSFS